MKNARTLTLLSVTTVALSACATAQDKQFVDSMDCKAMAEMQRTMPSQPAAIIDNWDRERGIYPAGEKGILNQSRPAIRESYLRKEYNKRCK